MNTYQALMTLDAENDDHWTSDGLPRIDVVAKLTKSRLKRADITNAAPDFTRERVQEVNAAEDKAAAPDPATDQEKSNGEAHPEKEEGTAPAVKADAEATQEGGTSEITAQKAADLAAHPIAEPPPEPMSELDRLREELAKVTITMLDAQRESELAKKTADDCANAVNALNRRIEVLFKRDPNHGTQGVRAYLKQQNLNRINRAAGLRKFLEVTGVTSAQVATAIDPRSPIDRAFSSRKPGRGTVRPKYAAR